MSHKYFRHVTAQLIPYSCVIGLTLFASQGAAEPSLDANKRGKVVTKIEQVQLSPLLGGGQSLVYKRVREKPEPKPEKVDVPAFTAVDTPVAKVEPTPDASLPMDNAPPRPVVMPLNPQGNEQELLNKVKANKAKATGNKVALPKLEKAITKEQAATDKNKNAGAKLKPEVKPEDTVIDRLEFNQANMLDVARALSDISGLNFVATEEASKKNVTVFLQKISVKNALDAITKNSGLWYRQDKESGTFRIMSTDEYQKDMVVYREDTTRVFNLLNPNPTIVATAIRDLYGQRVLLSFGSDYDDFSTGQFNGNAGNNRNNGNNTNNNNTSNTGANAGGNAGGAGLGNGANSLRRPVTSGNTAVNNQRNGGQNNNTISDLASGTAGNGAIVEKFTPDQLSRLEKALAVDENGNMIASNAIRGITNSQQPIYVTMSRQQNMMIVRSSDNMAIREIENLVKALDKPTPQVLLEMRILEVDVGDAYNQLFSFSALSQNLKQRAVGVSDSDATGTGKFIYSFVDKLISVRLEMLEKNNQAKTVSSPVLLASNNRTARLFVGEERLLIRGATLTDPVLNANGAIVTPGKITYETELRNIGDTLNILPKINADGTVTLGIFQDTSTVNEKAVDFPPLVANTGQVFNFSIDTVNTANIEGVVVAKDGLTVAIGGLIRTSASNVESKIPVLSDIPIIGGVFKDKQKSVSRKELVLLITPHIINSPNDSDDVTRDTIEPLTELKW